MTTAIASLIRPRSSFIIATSPRSGSWLLAEGLQATNVAGRPREWFHRVAERDRSERWNIPDPSESGYTSYLDRVLRSGTTPNGVFGLKCHWYQLELLPDKLATINGFQDLPLFKSLAQLLPNLKYIWLTRRNKIRQAISLHRARRTGTWWHPDSYATKRPVLAEATYDPDAIDEAERHLLSNEMGWQQWFSAHKIRPLLVIYEDLVADYENTLRRALNFLEIPEADDVPIAPTTMKPQSDGRTDEWLKQYGN
jgi:LPS sulfotransferase NodH